MSILINGVDVPKVGEHPIWISLHSGGTVEYNANKGDGWQMTTAVPVQPHGRLIDADALMFEIQEYIEEYGLETDEHGWHNLKWCAMKEAEMAINDAPTIIPEEPFNNLNWLKEEA